MAEGPGKYGAICTVARETAQADGAIVIIMGGNQGQGFSVQATFDVQLVMPTVLRDIADQIEASTKAMGH